MRNNYRGISLGITFILLLICTRHVGAEEVWVENLKESRFFLHAYRAWQQGQLAAIDGIQLREDVDFPKDQF